VVMFIYIHPFLACQTSRVTQPSRSLAFLSASKIFLSRVHVIEHPARYARAQEQNLQLANEPIVLGHHRIPMEAIIGENRTSGCPLVRPRRRTPDLHVI